MSVEENDRLGLELFQAAETSARAEFESGSSLRQTSMKEVFELTITFNRNYLNYIAHLKKELNLKE